MARHPCGVCTYLPDDPVELFNDVPEQPAAGGPCATTRRTQHTQFTRLQPQHTQRTRSTNTHTRGHTREARGEMRGDAADVSPRTSVPSRPKAGGTAELRGREVRDVDVLKRQVPAQEKAVKAQ